MEWRVSERWHPWLLLVWIALLAFFFAKVEIQIEGGNGWASSLPTWKIEKHWLLDIFWGGRAMTGYHAWVFSFMALIFHLPIFFTGTWNWRLEARILALLMAFWIIEDFLWFVLNPAFGWSKFQPAFVPWHKNWYLRVPVDYLVFLGAGAILYFLSFRGKSVKG